MCHIMILFLNLSRIEGESNKKFNVFVMFRTVLFFLIERQLMNLFCDLCIDNGNILELEL
jgi:hypothetical protein